MSVHETCLTVKILTFVHLLACLFLAMVIVISAVWWLLIRMAWLVNVISCAAVLMRLLMRLFFQRGNLMLFLLVREMSSFYSQKHSLTILSLTFISSKHDRGNYYFLMDPSQDAIFTFIIQKLLFSPSLPCIHAYLSFIIPSLLLLFTLYIERYWFEHLILGSIPPRLLFIWNSSQKV